MSTPKQLAAASSLCTLNSKSDSLCWMLSELNLIGSITIEVACAHTSPSMTSSSRFEERQTMDIHPVADEVNYYDADEHAPSLL